jgi:acyl carrier protein
MNAKLVKIIQGVMAVPAQKVTPESTFDSMGCDSLDIMDILIRCDDAFGIDLSLEEFDSAKTFGELDKTINEKVGV